ncbi:MAG: hypothetical protein HC875_14425 [Anaerolineales bacterium]|nr:hypothetical protein [Anaerolineales bacterium]
MVTKDANPISEPPLTQGEVDSYDPARKKGSITYMSGNRPKTFSFNREQIMGGRDPERGDKVEFESSGLRHNATKEGFDPIARNIRIISRQDKMKQSEPVSASPKKSMVPKTFFKKTTCF